MTRKMLAALLTATALGLAGCGGGGHPTPQVAKLPTSAGSTHTNQPTS